MVRSHLCLFIITTISFVAGSQPIYTVHAYMHVLLLFMVKRILSQAQMNAVINAYIHYRNERAHVLTR